jgi:hypothetical protein
MGHHVLHENMTPYQKTACKDVGYCPKCRGLDGSYVSESEDVHWATCHPCMTKWRPKRPYEKKLSPGKLRSKRYLAKFEAVKPWFPKSARSVSPSDKRPKCEARRAILSDAMKRV